MSPIFEKKAAKPKEEERQAVREQLERLKRAVRSSGIDIDVERRRREL